MIAQRPTARDRLRDAAATTLVVHGVRSGTALLLVLPLLAELAAELPRGAYGARLGAAELEALLEVATRSGRRLLPWALGCAVGYALLSPLLALAWQCALARKQSVAASFARAASGYLPALALGACALLAWTVTFAAAALALQPALASALPHSAAFERTWTGTTVAAVFGSGLLIGTLHDLARARLALGARLGHALRAAVHTLSARLLAQHALLACAIAAVTAGAELVGRMPLALPAAALLGQQLLALGATLLRGTWLALALGAAETTPDTRRANPPRS